MEQWIPPDSRHIIHLHLRSNDVPVLPVTHTRRKKSCCCSSECNCCTFFTYAVVCVSAAAIAMWWAFYALRCTDFDSSDPPDTTTSGRAFPQTTPGSRVSEISDVGHLFGNPKNISFKMDGTSPLTPLESIQSEKKPSEVSTTDIGRIRAKRIRRKRSASEIPDEEAGPLVDLFPSEIVQPGAHGGSGGEGNLRTDRIERSQKNGTFLQPSLKHDYLHLREPPTPFAVLQFNDIFRRLIRHLADFVGLVGPCLGAGFGCAGCFGLVGDYALRKEENPSFCASICLMGTAAFCTPIHARAMQAALTLVATVADKYF